MFFILIIIIIIIIIAIIIFNLAPPTIQSDDASIKRRTVVNECSAYSIVATIIFLLSYGALNRVNTVTKVQNLEQQLFHWRLLDMT